MSAGWCLEVACVVDETFRVTRRTLNKEESMSESIHVGIDVGARSHHVGIATSQGEILEELVITHCRQGFDRFFQRVEHHRRGRKVKVAMEGYGGHARPLDQEILRAGYQLLNVNNLKLARFREAFPAPAKTDGLDVRLILDLLAMEEGLRLSKQVLEAGGPLPRGEPQAQEALPQAPGAGGGEGADLLPPAAGPALGLPGALVHHRLGLQPVVSALPLLPQGPAPAGPPEGSQPAQDPRGGQEVRPEDPLLQEAGLLLRGGILRGPHDHHRCPQDPSSCWSRSPSWRSR